MSVDDTGNDSEPRDTDSSYPDVPKGLGTSHPGRAALYRRWERMNVRDEHWMCCVVGEEGSGKSYTALKLAKMIDPSFDESQAFFNPANLLEVLEEDEYSRGDVYVVDEAGVGLGNRTWHDEEQIATNQALQLIRDHNIAVIFTLPRLSELDTQTKGRLQDVIEMRDKEDGEFVRANWWTVDVDRLDFSSGRDGTWMQKLEWRGREVDYLDFTPPEYEFIEAYEEQKDEFQAEVYADARGEEGDEEENELSDPKSVAAKIVQDGVESVLGWHGGHNKPIIKTQQIHTNYPVSRADAQAVKDILQRSEAVDTERAWERSEGTQRGRQA